MTVIFIIHETIFYKVNTAGVGSAIQQAVGIGNAQSTAVALPSTGTVCFTSNCAQSIRFCPDPLNIQTGRTDGKSFGGIVSCNLDLSNPGCGVCRIFKLRFEEKKTRIDKNIFYINDFHFHHNF